MRYEVPQFIDIEDKIFGPLTFKQFIYLAGGAGLCFAAYKLLPIIFSVPVIVVIVGSSLALLFYKFNNQSFLSIAQSFIQYVTKDKLYVWEKDNSKPKPTIKKEMVIPKTETQPVSIDHKKIESLARNLDILDKTRYN